MNKLNSLTSSSVIKRHEWSRALFEFDLTPDFDHDDHYSLVRNGNLRLEADFEPNSHPNDSINILVYAEFDNMIEITHGRNIIYDYTS